MKSMRIITLTILLSFFSMDPVQLFAQNDWTEGEVTVQGTVLNYKPGESDNTVSFLFADLLYRDRMQTYTAQLDSEGKFEIKAPVMYAQDFYIRYNKTLASLVCAPGDKLVIELDETKKQQASVRVVGGNRIKDNADYSIFMNGILSLNDQNSDDHAAEMNATEYKKFFKSLEGKHLNFLAGLKKKNSTSAFFIALAEDYIRYGYLESLMRYHSDHATRKKIKRDSVKVPAGYYSFLSDYNMNDDMLFSLRHAGFLNEFKFYANRNPTDSLVKAMRLFRSDKLVPGAKVLMKMLEMSSSGFTKDFLLTYFFLDALAGKQLGAFEALYNPNMISSAYFKKLIATEHENVKKFMANQDTGEANIQKIKGTVAKSLIDTLLAKYSGKVIYIDFWAPWCSPCMAEMPASKIVQEAYMNKNVIFLFLGNQCEASSWKATIANKKLTGEHILLTRDQFNVLAAEFGISGIPHYVLADSKGNIVNKNAVRPSDPDLKKQLDNLLGK